jgi:prepilin-type N-terminal cleavage/methylation domain-containing protein
MSAENNVTTTPSRKAFTLVELLVVIAIIAILATLTIPSLFRAIELANRAACAANLHAIGRSMTQYAGNHDTLLPGIESSSPYWHAIGYNNNEPTSLSVADGTRPLFLLIAQTDTSDPQQTEYASPGAFVCPSVSDAEPDQMPYNNQCGFTSYRNISYSYQHQTRIETLGFSLSLLDKAGGDRVIMADKNPLTSHQGSTGTASGTTFYRVETTGLPHNSMSVNHGDEGQNVLKLGGTVEFSASVSSGTDANIWAPANKTSGSLNRTEPPFNAADIFLVP